MLRLVLLALTLLAGCAAPGTLVAETGHHRLTAQDRETGITVILTTGAWVGQPKDLENDLTVFHVLVANMGKKPVLLAPGDIELRDLRGFRYDLLDVGAVFYRVDKAKTGGESGYGRDYRDDYDHGGSTKFQTVAAGGDLAANALPWGVLEPGTQMRGYLYFESLSRTANGAKLVWHLGTPEHQPLIDVAFDLYVSRKGKK